MRGLSRFLAGYECHTKAVRWNISPGVAMTLDHPEFCDLIVDALERLTEPPA